MQDIFQNSLRGIHETIKVAPMADLNLNSLIGKYLIVGLTYLNSDGTLDRNLDLHGEIMRIDGNVLYIKLLTGQEFALPADPRAFKAAPPGVYTFPDTGDTVMNPDYMATWTIEKSDDAPDPVS